MADPWAQVGATAIAWEMEKLGVDPPETWTIDRILKRAGVPKRRARRRYVPKGTPYPPAPLLVRPNAIHEIDLVGPRHLHGAISFYALNAVDLGRRRAAIEILTSKEEWEVADGLTRLWRRLGVPKHAKFDNGQTIQGRGCQLAVPVWTCLALGVGPLHPVRRAMAQPGHRALQRRLRQALLPHRDIPGPRAPQEESTRFRALP